MNRKIEQPGEQYVNVNRPENVIRPPAWWESEPLPRPLVELRARFLARVTKETNGCWTWNGSRTRRGYGRFVIAHGRQPASAHRFAFLILAGRVLRFREEVDHLCRNHPCVNPDHLDGVSHATNVRRGKLVKDKPICGHEFGVEMSNGAGKRARRCPQCRREYLKEWKVRNR